MAEFEAVTINDTGKPKSHKSLRSSVQSIKISPSIVVSSNSPLLLSVASGSFASHPVTMNVNECDNDDIIDLTDVDDSESDNFIDLTSPTTPDQPRAPCHISNTRYRPSCKYEKPLPSSDSVILLDSTPTPHKSDRKAKTKKLHTSPVLAPYSLEDHQSDKKDSTIKCPICFETAPQFEKAGSKLVSTTCGHIFCSRCIRDSITTSHKCPTCRKKLSLKSYHQIFL